jgi:2'-5' RNA ligase
MHHVLALRLADAARDRLSVVADRFKAWELPAAWVDPDDYHLTVVFIGALDADEVRILPHLIEDVARSLRRPWLRLSGLGAHGGRSEPRVVFAGLEDPERACAGMHADLCETLELKTDPNFMPQIPLCRPHSGPNGHTEAANGHRDWPTLLSANGLADWGECPTTELVLYQCLLGRTVRYNELASWPLVQA